LIAFCLLGIFRDDKADLVDGFAARIGVFDALHAEWMDAMMSFSNIDYVFWRFQNHWRSVFI
jgi:hypothetical protein